MAVKAGRWRRPAIVVAQFVRLLQDEGNAEVERLKPLAQLRRHHIAVLEVSSVSSPVVPARPSFISSS
jgi:hypothetical protein